MKRKVNQKLILYVAEKIAPAYKTFDPGHDERHMKCVIKKSLSYAKKLKLDVDYNIVYMVAALHDMGLATGRKNHEKKSGEYVRACEDLHQFFNDEEIELIAQAVEDHRASNNHTPRSIYGKIVSDADRRNSVKSILVAMVRYRVGQPLDLVLESCYTHLLDKYGENGYQKFYLNIPKNIRYQKRLWKLIENTNKLHGRIRRIYKQVNK